MRVPAPNELHEITIVRSGGFAGTTEQVTIGQDLVARVDTGRNLRHRFSLDGHQAEDLLHALARVAHEQPRASDATGFDLFQYDIDLRWNGIVYRIQSVDLGADEALHGVMMVANDLISRAGQDQQMGLRAQPAQGVVGFPH